MGRHAFDTTATATATTRTAPNAMAKRQLRKFEISMMNSSQRDGEAPIAEIRDFDDEATTNDGSFDGLIPIHNDPKNQNNGMKE